MHIAVDHAAHAERLIRQCNRMLGALGEKSWWRPASGCNGDMTAIKFAGSQAPTIIPAQRFNWKEIPTSALPAMTASAIRSVLHTTIWKTIDGCVALNFAIWMGLSC